MHNTHQSQTSSKTNEPGCSNPDLCETSTANAAKTELQMEAQHSKGPWTVEASHPWVVMCESNIVGVKATICEVGYKPNAHLIAAAPDLLESLNNLVNNTNEFHDGTYDYLPPEFEEFVEGAKAAIAKATGKGK